MGFPPLHHHFVAAVYGKEQDAIFDQQMQAASVGMGTLDESQLSGLLALTLARIKSQNEAETRRKQSVREILHYVLLEYIDNLNRDIAKLEAGFEAQFGDAWREEIALRVFGPDAVPAQRPGERIDDYRARLERELREEMLNPDGSIKDRYKDDPELEKYAEWAQKVYNREAGKAIANNLKNPASTHAQTHQPLQRLQAAQNAEQNNYAADALEGHDQQKGQVLNISDSYRDDKGAEERSSTAVSNFNDLPTPV